LTLNELCSTREIWEYLDDQTKEKNRKIKLEAQELFENDKLHSLREKKDYISERKRKGKTIDIRTIERHLKEDNRIKKQGSRYFIPDRVKNEIRYLNSRIFGRELLNSLSIQSYTQLTTEQYITELIQRFGALVVYSFIEGARPFEDNSLNVYERDRLVESWIQNAIPIQDMFIYFHSIFSKRDISEYDPEIEPMNELDNETIGILAQTLKKKYPKIYENMYYTRLGVFGKHVGRNFDADISNEE
jgi:hypothetical protein